ncbi:MAG: T9SS type A sorting domain-containing protein [Flavobacteriales bacterium]|nr:T9SS type A sorting domain-containing protein [Flavobacteriales bacterium]MCC6938090.1 T9SS type A sorting domain-containing protein [Flavobacteriales bacterium]
MRKNLRLSMIAVMVCSAAWVRAQSEDIAYVPREAPERTADDAGIDLRKTDEAGVMDLVIPAGTRQVDLINASGNVVWSMPATTTPQLDLRELRTGTWTIRAHTDQGARVRRFLVLGNSGTMWTDQVRRPARKR